MVAVGALVVAGMGLATMEADRMDSVKRVAAEVEATAGSEAATAVLMVVMLVTAVGGRRDSSPCSRSCIETQKSCMCSRA